MSAQQEQSRVRGVKSSDVADVFRQRILAGELDPGARLPSFSEMREIYGAAHNTVERIYIALENEGLVRREHGRGVFVAERARPARQHAIGCAGFQLDERRFPYWIDLMEGIQEVAQREELEVVLLHPNTRRGLEKVDGILVHGPHDTYELPQYIPCVSMIEPMQGARAVVADDFGGTKAATEYLIALGHRRIACLMFKASGIIQQRLAGYRTALDEAGIRPDPAWEQMMQLTPAPHVRDMARWNIEQWLYDGWEELGCTALLCQNDAAAIGVIEAFTQAGMRVPEDVSVVGFDGTEDGQRFHPRLTTVHVPLRQIGATAAELLLRQINDVPLTASILTLPTTLVAGESCAAPNRKS